MNIYDFTVNDAQGKEVVLSDYKGKVLLVVNTATGCGFTPQYEGLEDLFEKYHDMGFEILDFPCNQFAGQAPGTEDEIVEFCSTRFGVTFKQFAKINVNGKDENPLYTWLKSQEGGIGGSRIKWNFTKFLINKNGEVDSRYASKKKPVDLEKEIERLIGE